MTDKTEEQIAKEKAAVDAMRNAKGNMETALARISTLEIKLRGASQFISGLKDHVGPMSITMQGDNRLYVKDTIQDEIAAIAKVLG